MTNLTKKKTESNMRSHKETVDFLKKYLKRGYVEEAKNRLNKIDLEISSQMIRQIKAGYSEDWKVLRILAEIAQENELAHKEVSEIINNN